MSDSRKYQREALVRREYRGGVGDMSGVRKELEKFFFVWRGNMGGRDREQTGQI